MKDNRSGKVTCPLRPKNVTISREVIRLRRDTSFNLSLLFSSGLWSPRMMVDIIYGRRSRAIELDGKVNLRHVPKLDADLARAVGAQRGPDWEDAVRGIVHRLAKGAELAIARCGEGRIDVVLKLDGGGEHAKIIGTSEFDGVFSIDESEMFPDDCVPAADTL